MNRVSGDFARQIGGYGLTTASIFYRLPDHPIILQEYIWQDYDLFPKFPELQKFLDFWEKRLDGRLHSVRVAHKSLVSPSEIKSIGPEFRLH